MLCLATYITELNYCIVQNNKGQNIHGFLLNHKCFCKFSDANHKAARDKGVFDATMYVRTCECFSVNIHKVV